MKKDLPPRLHKRGKNYIYTPYVNGKVQWHNLGPDRAKALQRWAELEGGEVKQKTVADALMTYLAEGTNDLAESTVESYTLHVDRLMSVFGHMGLEDVKPSHISQYIYRRGYQGNREAIVLSNSFKLAVLKGWMEHNPAWAGVITKAKEPKRVKEILIDDVLACRSVALPCFQRLMDFAVLTALRKRDIFNLTWHSVSDDGIRVNVSKTTRPLLIGWTDELKQIIDDCPKTSVHVFTNSQGKPLTESGFNSTWKRIKQRAGVTDFRFHDLRRYALQEAERIGGIKFARQLADHTTAMTTQMYLAGAAKKVVPLR